MSEEYAARLRQSLGGSFIVLATVDSTMRVMSELIDQNYRDGITVLALEQTAGRGSGDRKWASAVGNAMFSRCIAVLPDEYGQEMEMIAACAVAEIMRDLLPDRDVTLKYPNDVLVDGKKICGCLVPPSYDVDAGVARRINLGVGVNLKVAPELSNGMRATSLSALGKDTDIPDFMRKFEDKFANILGQYRQDASFDTVLRRMGFLDVEGMLTLRSPQADQDVRGTYVGFTVKERDGKPAAFLVLRSQGVEIPHPVHAFTMFSQPQRRDFSFEQQTKHYAYG